MEATESLQAPLMWLPFWIFLLCPKQGLIMHHSKQKEKQKLGKSATFVNFRRSHLQDMLATTEKWPAAHLTRLFKRTHPQDTFPTSSPHHLIQEGQSGSWLGQSWSTWVGRRKQPVCGDSKAAREP